MPEMPSVDMATLTSPTITTSCPMRDPEFNILSRDVENLVSEIKENLRLSAASNSMKSLSCSQLSRKSSRASPYHKARKLCCDTNACSSNCVRINKRKSQQESSSEITEDPYELLQKLLRDGSLVSEAVRRVKLGLSPKQRYFYDSDDESKSPMLRFFPQEN